jgi:hypothetical protein
LSNPYVKVHRRIRQNQGWRPRGLLPVIAAALAVPLVGPTLLWFLPADGAVSSDGLARGLSAVGFRLAAVVAGAVLLRSYSDLVRGPDRSVLDVHPVQPRALVSAIARRTTAETIYLPLVGAVLLLPVGLAGYWVAWATGAGLVLSGWLGALGVGFAVHLGGVWAATSPGMSRLLDLIRGDNPRMQAALIYGPGVGLAVVGVALAIASVGLEAALLGWAPGWAMLLVPPAAGFVAWSRVGLLAERHYVRASLVLAEIASEWGGQEEPEEALEVYLEGVGAGRPELLRALRHGWRRLRTYGTGAWVLGIFAGAMAWSSGPMGRSGLVGAAAVLVITAVAARMGEGDPAWLDHALGVRPAAVARARGLVAFLYAQGVVLPMAGALILHEGLGAWPLILGLEVVAFLGAVLGALSAGWWRSRAVWAYGPAGLLVWAGFVRIVG